jgi:riboflavin kinase/FMN adenylyltransferase
MGQYIATTGFFDGVHSGHVAVFDSLRAMGAACGLPVCVVSFWPHPRIVTGGASENFRLLSTPAEKERRIRLAGIDNYFVVPFTRELAEVSPERFIIDELAKRRGIAGLCVGHDHHIGKNRAGGYGEIKAICDRAGLYCEQIAPLTVGGLTASSEKIRRRLAGGDIAGANLMLGYSYRLTGRVVYGRQFGRTIGFPTANIEVNDPLKLIPADGVYAVTVAVGDERDAMSGMLFAGKKPSIDDSGKTFVEVNIFDFDGDLYGKELTVGFEHFIRNNRIFEDVAAMKDRLTSDKREAREKLRNYKSQ